MLSALPAVSIIIVNYNGKDLLSACLSSLARLDYPEEKLEIIVVDNASSDGSAQLIQEFFPLVKLLRLPKNTGFTGGNNAGINAASGEYLVLLNNDTEVAEDWLTQLVLAAEPTHVGLVTSKLLLRTQFVELTIELEDTQSPSDVASSSASPKKVFLETISDKTGLPPINIWYDHGFSAAQTHNGVAGCWVNNSASILLPIEVSAKTFTLTFHGTQGRENQKVCICGSIGKQKMFSTEIKQDGVQKVSLQLRTKDFSNESFHVIQNAGNMVLKNGYSKDRGNITRITDKLVAEHYEKDSAYFNKSVAIPAICGAACLIKRKVIDEIGELDEKYFMYYEDLELSIRAWRMGWESVYAPQAIVLHAHRTTTGRTLSSFSMHMTEKNHLFMLIQHFAFPTVAREVSFFLARLFLDAIKQQVFRFSKPSVYREYCNKVTGRMKATGSVFRHFPVLILDRLKWKHLSKRSFVKFESGLY